MEVPISEIIVDPQIQLKARRVDNDTVAAYVEAITNGSQFPPVTIFQNGEGMWLADGFHRLSAVRFLGQVEIDAEIRQGTKEDAMIHAAIANIAHGRPMKPSEKKEAGERLIKLTDWKDVKIAQHLAVNKSTVGRWREKVANATEKKPKKSTKQVPGLIDLICGDFAEVGPKLEPESIDAIITDPPYSQDALHLYEVLAKQAERLLKPGGSVLAMAGQSYLPAIFNMMQPHLAYQWTISYLTPGGQAPQLWQRKVNAFWKPVLWFVKGDYTGPWIGDVVKSAVNDNDKRFHEWGQSESGMAELVEKFSQSGDLILDPFCGAGTTGVVAIGLKRRFIGIDIKPENVVATKGRLNSLGS